MRWFGMKSCVLVLLTVGCLALAGSADGTPVSGAVYAAPTGLPSANLRRPTVEYRLRLHRAHRDERVEVVYRRGSEYLASAVQRINHFLRDYRTEQEGHYDVREFDLLYLLMQRLHRPNGTIDVLCGYRSPASNAYLRSRFPATGAAENSMHMQAKAIDIRVPGVSTETLRKTALSLHMGGVGYYPEARFVHVDVGPVREWIFEGGRMKIAGQHNAMNRELSSSTRERVNDGEGMERQSGQ